MDYTFLTGIIGSLILVVGSAWPDSKKKIKPIQSVKNWLFAIGGIFMLAYAILGYLAGGAIFFVFLESLIFVASILMMADIKESLNTAIISVSGAGLIIWSYFLFTGFNTLFFIIGLSVIALGYIYKMASLRRNIALTIGSGLIALFSFIEANWIFFLMNLFFAIFSGYYMIKSLTKK